MTITNKRTLSWAALTSLLLLVVPVLARGTDNNRNADTANNSKKQLIAAAASAPSNSSNFAMRLFTEVTKESSENESNKNVVVSPFSAYAALSMTLNGAAGSTRDQMAKVLGATPGSIDALNRRNQSVFAALSNNDDKIKLEIANAIYADSHTPFKHEFMDLCKQLYGAEIQNLSFGSPAAVEAINSWCNDKTHGKIPKILDSLSRSEKMVLLNAVYFKGKWENPFKDQFTQDDSFTMLSGDKLPIKMMHQSGGFAYFRSSDFEALSMPYAGKRQSMYVFLPDKGIDLPAFCAEFTDDNWKQWMASFHNARVNLSLPRFTVRFSTDLSSALKKMGMTVAFSPGAADFSNMIGGYRAWISRVLQKTYMDVNEEGTEAAAVTAVVMAARAVHAEPPPVQFRVDHPFVLALVDNDTGEILFIGLILEPTTKS